MQLYGNDVAASAATSNLARGQKLAIIAILVNLANLGIGAAVPPLGLVIGLGAAALMMVAVWQLGDGLDVAVALRVLLMILMLVPLVSLLVLVLLNQRATARLRAAGHRVGFFGVKR